jgi:tetratricopeptide (TPR) repeat protein
MGTVAYMSPEQARGREIDARSDIFSFGVVMYEVLSGGVPFTGETAMDVVSAILNRDPQPLTLAAPHLPKELHRIVNKSLKKKPDQRYQTTRDLLIDLKDLKDELHLESQLERTAVPDKPETEVATSAPRISTNSGGMKEALLLTEVENTTGDPIFDHTLKMALSFSLAQSPFVDILPDNKVGQTLSMMGRSPNERVTRELGEEICVRQNLKAYIAGTISSFGSIYILTLEAVSRTGEIVAREFEQANSREEVLSALGRAASGLREKLGESLSSIEKFDMPGSYATTSSLEALKLYTLARQQVASGKHLEAIPFYKKALEIDPNFATAYSALSVFYANTNQWNLAREMASKAYELRETVSENEKLRINVFYYNFVTGEMDKSLENLQLWRKTYPSQIAPPINLSDRFEKIGQYEKAVSYAREAIQLDASNAVGHVNLAGSLLLLGRYAEVKEALRQAFEKNLDSDYFHWFLYNIALIENDATAMGEQLEWFSGRNDEYLALDLQTVTAAFRGKWREAQDFSRRSIDLAIRSNAREVAAQYAAEQALRIAFWSAGSGLPTGDEGQLKTVLKTQTNKALNLERGKDVMSRAALALAAAGQAEEANSLLDELHQERPKDTILNELWLPTARAAILLQSGKAKEAIEELEVAERFERASRFYPQYLRGLAFLQLRKPKAAVREFDKILNHRGEDPLSSVYPLAQLAKARALKDKAEYEKFFELWNDADADMPALVAAKKEFEALA